MFPRRITIIAQALFASFTFCMACCTAFGYGTRKNAPGGTVAHTTSTLNSAKLTFALDSISKKTLIPGFSVVVVDESGLLYSKGFGYADVKTKAPFTANSVHWVASISKTFIALALMTLVDDNKLSLDEPINSILPYKIVNPYFPNTPITVRHLVTHTSSINDSFEPYYVGEASAWLVEPVDAKNYPDYMLPNINYYKMGKPISLVESIRKYTQPKAKWYSDSTFLPKEPGTHYQYSNLASTIAALVVETRAGMPFAEYTKKRIFAPLKMKNTGWKFDDVDSALVSKIYAFNTPEKPTGVVEYPQHYSAEYPAGGLVTTALDMANYLHEMIKGSVGKGALLSATSYQTLFKSQSPPASLQTKDPTDMGVFWFLTKNTASHRGGNDGVYSIIYFNLATKRGAFAHANLRDDDFGDIYNIVRKYEEEGATALQQK